MLEKFSYIKTKQLFLEYLNQNLIFEDAIVFIEDTKEIWTRGVYFECQPFNHKMYYNQKQINQILTEKQDKLISKTNIKTINGNTLLGEGDLTDTLSLKVKEALMNCFNKVAWVDNSAPLLLNQLANSLNLTNLYNLNKQGYISDDLLFYYDGIDNSINDSIETAYHKDNLSIWNDLSGNNYHLTCYSDVQGTITKSAATTSNSVVFDGSTYFFLNNTKLNDQFNINANGTLEIVFFENSSSNVSVIFMPYLIGSQHKQVLWFRPSTNSYITTCKTTQSDASLLNGVQIDRIVSTKQISIIYSELLIIQPELVCIDNTEQNLTHQGGTMSNYSSIALGGRKTSQSTDGYTLNGEILAVRYYTRILSEEERLINYNNDKNRFNI